MNTKVGYLVLCASELVLAGAVASRIAARERNLVTGLIFLAAVGVALLLIGELGTRVARCSAETKAKLRLLVATVVLTLPAIELYLRFGMTRFATYLEKNGSANYQSLFEYDRSSWFHVHPPNQDVVYLRPEFTHRRTANSLGLSEREIQTRKRDDEFRLIALGDSYTEGVGTDYENTWVKVAERRLAAAVPRRLVSTVNAGISGSDVVFEYVLLREKLSAYRPDLVVVATNTSDAVDVSVMGGRERLNPDGSLRPGRRPPGWEWLYSISYIFRPFVHGVLRYDWRFIQRSQQQQAEREAAAAIGDVFDDFALLARQRGFRLLVVILPTSWEASHQTWTGEFETLLARLRKTRGLFVMDLMERLRHKGVMDRQNAGDFYWPLDGHFNPRGYEAMGNAVADAILEFGLLDPVAADPAAPAQTAALPRRGAER